MLNKINTHIHSYVVNFPENDFEKKILDDELAELDNCLSDLMPVGWKLDITYFFINTDHTGITKKQQTINSDKQYRSTFLLPIPSIDEVSYGLKKSRFPKHAKPSLLYDSYLHENIDFQKYTSLTNMLLGSMSVCTRLFMEKGIKIDGKIHKFKR
ncbi:Imm9 family immunity protein [Ottowia thiooxydans]|uniref:Imm9 family immunity protein n=1 Tax=Ottowia thiooxydans TaxID=219182 RepID=UPI00048D433C|nr:Imm9 family immunity protein [Ottowia thiooxydans]